MNTFPNKLVLSAVLATALITGCGGGGGDAAPAPVSPTANIDMSVSALFTYISGLISGTGENGEAADVNALTLAVDDTAEPTAVD